MNSIVELIYPARDNLETGYDNSWRRVVTFRMHTCDLGNFNFLCSTRVSLAKGKRRERIGWITAAWPEQNRLVLEELLGAAAKRADGVDDIMTTQMGSHIEKAAGIQEGNANIRIIFSRSVKTGTQLQEAIRNAMLSIERTLTDLSPEKLDQLSTDLGTIVRESLDEMLDYHRTIARECGPNVTDSQDYWGLIPL